MFVENALPQSVKVLLVEDDTVQICVVQAVVADLPQLDLVAVARDGLEAIALLRRRLRSSGESLPDLILLDLNMPKMDGFEFLAELKATPILRRIPVVVFSTGNDQEDIDRAYDGGANSYVLKSARFDDLKRSLELVATYWISATRLPTNLPMARSA